MKYNLIATVYVNLVHLYRNVVLFFFFTCMYVIYRKKIESNNLLNVVEKNPQSLRNQYIESLSKEYYSFLYTRINCIRDEVTNVQA